MRNATPTAFINALPVAVRGGARDAPVCARRAARPTYRRAIAGASAAASAPPPPPSPSPSSPPVRSTEADTPKKAFLTKLKALGRVRLIVRNEAGILESLASFDSLFFATIRSGEYANIIDPSANIDLHLLLDKFSGARFEVGVSRTKSKVPTYSLRLLAGDRSTVALTVFLQWDKAPEDVEEHRIKAWTDLKAEYVQGDDDTFFFDEQ